MVASYVPGTEDSPSGEAGGVSAVAAADSGVPTSALFFAFVLNVYKVFAARFLYLQVVTPSQVASVVVVPVDLSHDRPSSVVTA
jgi:hypothetical protein